MKIVLTDSVPAHKRQAVRETVGAMLAASLARHPQYSRMMVVVGLRTGGRGWDVQIIPVDDALLWDELLLGVSPDLLEAVREALRLL